jgi:hypothetical protein
MIASEEEEFSKAVVLHSKRNGQEEHSNEIVLPQEEQHLKTMREISRESVWWWNKGEKEGAGV